MKFLVLLLLPFTALAQDWLPKNLIKTDTIKEIVVFIDCNSNLKSSDAYRLYETRTDSIWEDNVWELLGTLDSIYQNMHKLDSYSYSIICTNGLDTVGTSYNCKKVKGKFIRVGPIYYNTRYRDFSKRTYFSYSRTILVSGKLIDDKKVIYRFKPDFKQEF